MAMRLWASALLICVPMPSLMGVPALHACRLSVPHLSDYCGVSGHLVNAIVNRIKAPLALPPPSQSNDFHFQGSGKIQIGGRLPFNIYDECSGLMTLTRSNASLERLQSSSMHPSPQHPLHLGPNGWL
eukprot:6197760-Pleurochrysis_carterae.AAC.4